MGLRVGIVGAGAAGLAALKAGAGAGLYVTCFERGDRVGGIWVLDNSSGLSSAYKSLHCNTSRARTEFEDLPMPSEWPHFPDHVQVCEYFDAYLERFDLRRRIRFATTVERAAREPAGGWTVATDDGERHAFDALVVANGHNWQPRWPDPPYPGDFDGEQLHAHDYRDADAFAGRRVLIVGMGNSAMDIAVDASYVAESTLLSARRGTHIVPKFLFGKPSDQISGRLAARGAGAGAPAVERGAPARRGRGRHELRAAASRARPVRAASHAERLDPVAHHPWRRDTEGRERAPRRRRVRFRRRLARAGGRDRLVHGLRAAAAVSRRRSRRRRARCAPALRAHLPPG